MRGCGTSILPSLFGVLDTRAHKIRSAERYFVDTLFPLWAALFFAFYRGFLHFQTPDGATEGAR